MLGQKSGCNREKWVSEKKTKGGKREETVCLFRINTALKGSRFVALNSIVINAMLMYYGRLLCSLRL